MPSPDATPEHHPCFPQPAKQLLVEGGFGRRDQILAQDAFYSGARCVFRVLDHLAERGDVEELQRVIRRHGRTIRRLQGQEPRKRRH